MFGIGKYKICFLKIDDYFNNNILKGLIPISFSLILANIGINTIKCVYILRISVYLSRLKV